MRFKISRCGLNTVEGTIYFKDDMKSSLNITLINMTINLSVMRSKIKMFEKKEFEKEELFNKDKDYINLENIEESKHNKLSPIYELPEE